MITRIKLEKILLFQEKSVIDVLSAAFAFGNALVKFALLRLSPLSEVHKSNSLVTEKNLPATVPRKCRLLQQLSFVPSAAGPLSRLTHVTRWRSCSI